MSSYYLRVEAVNHANFLFDTDDISTRRGGSLTLLHAVAALHEKLPQQLRTRLTPLATGASIGLFAFDATSPDDAEAVRSAVAATLRQSFAGLPVEHATFVVDVVERGADAAAAHQQAVAANRWRQMQEPTLALVEVFDPASEPCELDNVRPATRTTWRGGGKKTPASASVAARREFGRGARQQFYALELGADLGIEFTDDLGTLGDPGDLPLDAVPSSTRDKLAVLYLDGNGFGAIGRERWKKPQPEQAFTEWSEAVRQHHRELLRTLLTRTHNDPAWHNGPQLRLETLLWGGDEIIWVVPAWKGWELLRWFYAQRHTVRLDGADRAVSYGGGLVFCHYNAPIQNIIHLTHRLADEAKKKAPTGAVAYEVLESFDDITGDLAAHRQRGLPAGRDPAELVLTATQLTGMAESLAAIARAADFPQRQLYQYNRAWRTGQDVQPHLDRLRASSAGKALDDLLATVGSEVAWLHLLTLLPYLPTAVGALER